MSKQGAYIIIDESRNLDDNTVSVQSDQPQKDVSDTSEEASQQMLHDQGILIEPLKRFPETSEPIEELSQELLNEGGIEIVPGEEFEGED